MSSFSAELGASFDVRLEAPHVIDARKQLWIGTFAASPRGAPLNGVYRFAEVGGGADGGGARACV